MSIGWLADDDGSLVALAAVHELENAGVLVIETQLLEDKVQSALEEVLNVDRNGFDTHDAKQLTRGLRQLGLKSDGLRVDTAIAGYLLDPSGGRYVLDELLKKYCRTEIVRGDVVEAGQLDLAGSSDDQLLDVARDALAVNRLAPTMSNLINERSMVWLYEEWNALLFLFSLAWKMPAWVSM